jgi:hypothetical protein
LKPCTTGLHQRPGLEPANYMRGWNDTAGRSAYRSDARSITKDLHDARYLLDYIAIRDSISAERILDAARHSFSGRLSITPVRRHSCNCGTNGMHPCNCPKRRPIYRRKNPMVRKVRKPAKRKQPRSYRIDYCIGQYWRRNTGSHRCGSEVVPYGTGCAKEGRTRTTPTRYAKPPAASFPRA